MTKQPVENPYGPALIGFFLKSQEPSTSLIADQIRSLIEQDQYDYVITPLTHHRYTERVFSQSPAVSESVPDVTNGDLLLSTDVNNQASVKGRIIGVISPYPFVIPPNKLNFQKYCQLILKELEVGKYIGLKELLIPYFHSMTTDLITAWGMLIHNLLRGTKDQGMDIIVEIPALSRDSDDDPLSTWDQWNTVRTICRYDNRLKVQLTVQTMSDSLIQRWYSEPVTMVHIPVDRWLSNERGFPVLSKSDQCFVLKFHQVKRALLIISDSNSSRDKQEYLNYLSSKKSPPLSKLDQFAFNHNDVPLPPLQPLSRNLSRHTYEVFGQDPVKYNQYGKAIKLALSDLIKSTGGGFRELNIAMVGAGTGLIVDQIIQSIIELGIIDQVNKLSIIEKNPIALLELQQKFQNSPLASIIEIIQQDMRTWSTPYKYHLIVSELLGSFGCNELSPECLLPLHETLHPQYGIMIPQSYESWCSVASYSKLHQLLLTETTTTTNNMAMERPYVIRPMEYQLLSPPVKLWTFNHHRYQPNVQLTKESTAEFLIDQRTNIHAIIGYFQSTLYADVKLNNMIDTSLQTPKDMLSWFPMVFPLSEPVYCMDESVVSVNMARRCEKDVKVWYEWCVESSLWLEVEKEKKVKRVKSPSGNVVCGNLGGMGFGIDIN
ncbi:hypothetical protein WICPIJ_000196 [Wickerhamomyces pijperi]|uniref:Protein arginine N-methyltransferase n=1 Tax=Wickerhamomyces pijperi TaxID=599730 RepID=A0A9P8QH92_WICPI|nr:hypothetical protein WICPIJ_000196 [Wickerhamomyces pijperi]